MVVQFQNSSAAGSLEASNPCSPKQHDNQSQEQGKSIQLKLITAASQPEPGNKQQKAHAHFSSMTIGSVSRMSCRQQVPTSAAP
eukprot:1159911-Pelagomonas_calceolata.AAC.18